MSAPESNQTRRNKDIVNLINRKHEVTVLEGDEGFSVKFHGPEGTPYEGGVWNVRVYLPEEYPFKSPSIGFINKIYHPNISEDSGGVCLNMLNETWTAMFDLCNVFDTFLPMLLTYPNAGDPLNAEAAALYLKERDKYNKKVQEHVKIYAKEHDENQEQSKSDTSDSSLSDEETMNFK